MKPRYDFDALKLVSDASLSTGVIDLNPSTPPSQAGLTNVTVVWGRAEDTVRLPNMRGTADVAVARAVADLRILSELCIPYVRKGGLFVAPKGPSPEEEVEAAARAIEVLGARVLALEKGETALFLLVPFSYFLSSASESRFEAAASAERGTGCLEHDRSTGGQTFRLRKR